MTLNISLLGLTAVDVEEAPHLIVTVEGFEIVLYTVVIQGVIRGSYRLERVPKLDSMAVLS